MGLLRLGAPLDAPGLIRLRRDNTRVEALACIVLGVAETAQVRHTHSIIRSDVQVEFIAELQWAMR